MASLTPEGCTAHRGHIFMRRRLGEVDEDSTVVNGHEFTTYADADLAGDIGTRKSKKGEERRRREKILISNFQAIFAKNPLLFFILISNFRAINSKPF